MGGGTDWRDKTCELARDLDVRGRGPAAKLANALGERKRTVQGWLYEGRSPRDDGRATRR